MHRLRIVLFAAALGGASFTACSGDDGGGSGPGAGIPIDSAATTARANANAHDNLMRVASVLNVLTDSEVITSLPLSAGEECAGGLDGEMQCSDIPISFDLTDVVGELSDFLAENVFTAENIVDERSNRVTYELSPAWLCGGDELEPADPDCLAIYEDVPIRVRVTSPSDGNLDVAVLVGSRTPATLHLYQTELSVEVDLGEVRAALVAIMQAAGEDVSDLPQMSGRIVASLSELTDTHAVATLSFVSAIAVSGQGWGLNVGAANPAARLELDSLADTLVGSLSLGSVDVSIPTQDLFGSTTEICDSDGFCYDEDTGPGPDGTLSAHLAGASASLALDGTADTLAFTNVGLGNGSSTLAFNGNEILRVDLNASAGRALDVALHMLEERLTVAVSPQLDLQVSLDFRNAEALNDDESYPAWLADEDLGVTLNGAANPAVAFTETTAGQDVIGVVEGTLTLTSRVLGLPVIANAGECLWSDDLIDAEHPFEAMLSGTCPE